MSPIDLRVERLRTTLVDVPLAAPIGTAIHAITSVGCVLVEVDTADGPSGQSYVFTINAERLRAFDEMITGLEPFVVGRPLHSIAGLNAELWSAFNPSGHKGVTISALSAIDVAMWDAMGHALATPLHHLWGSVRDRVPTYASSGLWLSQTIDELVAEAGSFVEAGFTAMKIRLGSEQIADDVARVRAVREAIGPDVALLSDANQKFDAKQAIRLGRALEPFNLSWFEEPVPAWDLAGHARVRNALDVPIASGETEYTRHGMQAMLAAGACDVLMPDLQRVGGYSEFQATAAIASAWNIPVSSHIFTEQSLCLAGSLPNCISVEHMDWFSPLFNEPMALAAGDLEIPDRPGHGFTFNPEAVERYKI